MFFFFLKKGNYKLKINKKGSKKTKIMKKNIYILDINLNRVREYESGAVSYIKKINLKYACAL